MTMPANRATPSTEQPTETEKTHTETTPVESDTETVLERSSGTRVVGKWSSGAVRNVRRIQA